MHVSSYLKGAPPVVGLLAASGAVRDRSVVEQGASFLEQLGFQVVLDERVFATHGYLAGTDEHRASVLTEYILDTSTDVILAVRGGYGMLRLLPLIDPLIFQCSAKSIVGFSDLTVLFSAYGFNSKVQFYHGPMITTLFGTAVPDSKSVEWFLQALFCSAGQLSVEGTPLREGGAEGVIMGGNLAVFTSLLGTPFFPTLSGHILFFEDLNEPLYKVDRMLSQLLLAGVFDSCVGVLVGDFLDVDQAQLKALFMERLQGFSMPIGWGFPFSHAQPNATIPIGAHVEMDMRAGSQLLTWRKQSN